MLELHPVEAAWRRFRNSDRAELLRRALGLRQSYFDFIGLEKAPPEIALPGGVAWNLVALDEAHARGEETGSLVSVDGSLLVNTVHVWAAYRADKTIYEIEPALVECLSRSPWPDDTPTAAVRLPSRCPVLSIARGDSTIHLAAVYDLVTGAEESGALELRISQYERDLWVPVCVLDLRGATLQECLAAADRKSRANTERALARAAEKGESTSINAGGVVITLSTAALWHNTTSALALTLLLYLAGEPAAVRIVHAGQPPSPKPKLQRTSPERYRDLTPPRHWTVGGNFRRAIERWEIEHAGEHGDPTERSVRPHMRRAHSHLYWTGQGREIPRVKFLLPISVRGGKLVEEPERPTETTVR